MHWLVPSVKLDYAIDPDTRLSVTSAVIEVIAGDVELGAAGDARRCIRPLESRRAARTIWNDHFHNSSTELRLVRHHNWLGSGSALAAGFRYYHSNMSRQHGWSAPGAEPIRLVLP